MKFGQNLPRNQVPEWASSYINYKGLKKLIKSAKQGARDSGDADLAEFSYALDRNLEDVDAFYNRKYSEFSRRLKLLHDRYGQAVQGSEGMDKDEMEDLMGALLELRSQYRKLQWYGEVNRRGFVKITKKLDKKIATSSSQNRYLATKVDPKAFATNFRLGNDMRAINDWLSGLGEVKVFDDDSSVHSAGSLHRVSSKGTLKLPSSTLDSVDTAIRQDEASTLHYVLAESTSDLSPDAKQRLCLNILQRAISCKSYRTIDFLLTQVESLDDGDDMNKRNIVHRLLIAIGRVRALEALGDTIPGTSAPDSAAMITAAELPTRLPVAFKVEERDAAKTLGKEDPSIKLLTHLLGQLTPAQQPALAAIDIYGRRPLHYAAQYGLVAASEEVMRCMRQWGQFDVSNGIDSQYWQDQEGYAPLHLSVIGGHYRTTKALLHAENWHGDADKSHVRKHVEKSGAALTLATKSNFYKIVQLLVEAGVDVNYQDNHGDTALHVAARFGFKDCAKALIAGYEGRKPNLELAESTYGWTPLFTACVDGHLPIVELLVAAGAEVDKVDLSGWRPIEHAALRGHIGISALLAKITPKLGLSSPTLAPTAAVSMSNTPSLDDRRSAREANTYLPKPVKTFGHRYLTKQSMVLVSLGSMDARKDMPAVKLDNIPLSDAHATQLDTALSIVVSTTGALGEPTVIDLPVQENISTSPITFYTSDPTKVRVMFDIVPTYAGSKDKIVGRGVALLSSIKPSIGSKRITLQGDLAVPVVAADTLDVIGCVNFNFLIITPFAHPNMSITEEQTYWKRTSTMVIGHRGLGKNMTAMKSLQLGENTIQSFIAAANLGASYVEFDVQLTKDHVPVIYHDFLVSETGMDAPVHTLTLEQFLHASGTQTPRSSRPPSPTLGKSTNGMSNGRKYRSYSLGAPDGDEKQNMDDRMKHTRDFKAKGFKANSRGNFIQAPFTTLQEMFEKVPQEVGFNIEMKYPMLHESEDHDMDTYAVELNSFVDTVLTKVYDLGKGRNIIFSSFHPDICLLLSLKQPSIPILFLTDAGIEPVGDIRASSIQEAIRFASRWSLLGIVSAAEPLVQCPRLVRVVKESGLVCVSYGALNNDTKNVTIQSQEGIDAVIVDNVLAIRKGLTANEAAAAKSNGGSTQETMASMATMINGEPIKNSS